MALKDSNMLWLKAALIRGIKTMAQTIIGMITVGAAISEVNWGYIFSVAAVAGFVSIITSIAGLPEISADGTIEVINEDESEIHFNPLSSLANNNDLKNGSIVRLKVTKK